jgi:replication-associated recombination protein RarA
MPDSAELAKRTAQFRSEKSVARWIWKTSLAFEANGALSSSADRIWAQMDSVKRTDVLRIAKRLVPWLQTMLREECVSGDRTPADSIGSQSLLHRYGPRRIQDFFGLEKPRRVLTSLAMEPRTTRLIFVGALGTGKSSLAIAFANEALAEVHYVPAKSCDLERVQRMIDECRYAPSRNFKPVRAHVCIVDEADQMSAGAQAAFLSVLDDMTPFEDPVIFIFTTNEATKLAEKFRSRCDPLVFTSEGISEELETKLAQVWTREGGDAASVPDFAKIVRDCDNNVRAAFNVLEMELLYTKGKSASDGQDSVMSENPGDETAVT